MSGGISIPTSYTKSIYTDIYARQTYVTSIEAANFIVPKNLISILKQKVISIR